MSKNHHTAPHFTVSADWMTKAGRGDSEKTFAVVRVEHDANAPEYDRIVLDSYGAEWPVFRIRGRFVQPFGLIIVHGRFEACDTAKEEPAGAVRMLHAEFPTIEEARSAAAELNTALQLVVVAELNTAPVETIRKGSTVRRLLRNGLPMLKEYTLDTYDKANDKYALLDGKGGVFWAKTGTVLAVD
jgi:hypothetical protein